MDLWIVREGAAFTIYSIEMGDSLRRFLGDLEKSDVDEHDRVLARLEQFAERGPSRKKDQFNDLGDGLFEAKTRRGTRVVFFYERNRIVICTHGFAKGKRKTPKKEIEKARKRKEAYEQVRGSDAAFRIIVPEGTETPGRLP